MMNILKQFFGNTETPELQLIIDEGAFLVDVRTPEEFAAGHVKGSVNIPLDTIGSKITAFKSKKNIVVFCRSGARSGQAKAILQQNGITDVVNGGAWDHVRQFVK